MSFKLSLHVGIALFAGASALVQVSPAHADNKGISATACQPFLPTTYSQALFKDNAVYNPTAGNQRVICPVNKDAFVDWSNGGVGFIVYIKAGASNGKVSCTLYGGGSSFGQPQVAYTGTSAVVTANSTSSFSIDGIADPSPGDGILIEGWNVLCTLNPGMSLGGFFVHEDYDTNG